MTKRTPRDCRKCGEPIITRSFGSDQAGWEHMEGECPGAKVNDARVEKLCPLADREQCSGEHCDCPLVPSVVAQEVYALRRWKDEAMTLLVQWDAIYQAAGRPGPLGRPMPENMGAYVAALRSEIEGLRSLGHFLTTQLSDDEEYEHEIRDAGV